MKEKSSAPIVGSTKLGHLTDALAATAPWWDPGTRHAYHTNTYGHLTGEIIRRVSGETSGHHLRSLAGPLDDFHLQVIAAFHFNCL